MMCYIILTIGKQCSLKGGAEMPRDKTEAHKRIIKAATSEFLEYGFEGASMRRIAENSGITAGALYKHFKNKEDMFSALVEPTINELMAKYQEFCEHGYDVMKCGDVQQLWNESESETKWLMSFIYDHFETFRLLVCRLYMPPPEPHLHGVRTALCRTLNRTQPDVDRTYPNPVY